MPPRIDLTGRQFENLTCIQATNKRNTGGSVIWECACKCGNKVEVSANSLLSGHTNSCGCYQKERVSEASCIDLTGQRFGRWLVIKEMGRKLGSLAWLCQCDCGTEKVCRSCALISGQSKSCGCLAIDMGRQRHTTHGLSSTKMYHRAGEHRRREARRKLDSSWVREMEYLLSYMYPSCVICNSTDRLATDHVMPLMSGYGLAPGNATKLCIKCNSIKGRKLVHDLPIDWQVKILVSAELFRMEWEEHNGYTHNSSQCA